MKKVILTIVFTLAILVGLMAAFSSAVSADNGPDWISGFGNGAVFTMTNVVTGNAVIMFSRDSHGVLTYVGSFLTGGDGGLRSGPPDPLMSSGSLMLTQDGKWLLAVNAGSSTVSVFQVKNNSLTLTDQESSGGSFPVSLTISGNEVFVLNGGTPNPNISGFNLSNNGKITAINNSTITLPSTSAIYTQVGFDNSGKWLAVSDLSDNSILTYAVNSGVPSGLKTLSSSGPAPFAFLFDARNNLISVQAGNSAVSSYSISDSGVLTPIVEAFNPTSSTACWIVEDQTDDLFTTNPGTANISSYQDLSNSGNVGWLNASAASGIATIDEGITNNGDFLYALGVKTASVNSAGNVYAFKISGNGSLKMVGPFSAPGLTNSSQGLAAW
jgi:6-phosphogluconolactonase (cycloisomerase 2 family)